MNPRCLDISIVVRRDNLQSASVTSGLLTVLGIVVEDLLGDEGLRRVLRLSGFRGCGMSLTIEV